MTTSRVASLLFVVLLAVACGDDGNSGTPSGFAGNQGQGGDDGGAGTDGGGGGAISYDDCIGLCGEKLSTCNAPASAADMLCPSFCEQTDDTQIACFSALACSRLGDASACPKGGSGKGGSSSGTGGTGGMSSGKGGTGGTGGTGGSSSGKGGTGGTGGTGGSSSGCTSTKPVCEGNKAISCDDSSGFPVMTTKTCQDGCTDGVCNGRPKELTVAGAWSGNPETVSVFDDKKGELSTLLTAEAKNAKPTPTVTDPPNLKGLTPTIVSPALGGCTLPLTDKISVGSGYNVIVSLLGTDKGASGACKTFLDKVASQGITATFTNVPYLNGGTADKVTIKITN